MGGVEWNCMKKHLTSNRTASFVAIVISVFFVVATVQAATTISTNIQTDGTLSVTGTSTIMGHFGVATTSPFAQLSVGWDGIATTLADFGYDGNLSNIVGTLAIDGPNNILETHSSYALGLDLYTHANQEFRAPYVDFYKSRGTQSSPTPLLYTGYELDSMGGINFGGYDGSTYAPSAAIYSNSDENWTSTAHGGHLSIYFTRLGATTQNQIVQFGGNDALGINGNDTLFGWPVNFFSNGSNGVRLSGPGGGALQMSLGDGTSGVLFTVLGSVGVGTSTPVANFQATNGSSNATTTIEFGKSAQNKGSCLKLYRTDGSAIYAYVAAGATTFTLTTTACASVSNF